MISAIPIQKIVINVAEYTSDAQLNSELAYLAKCGKLTEEMPFIEQIKAVLKNHNTSKYGLARAGTNQYIAEQFDKSRNTILQPDNMRNLCNELIHFPRLVDVSIDYPLARYDELQQRAYEIGIAGIEASKKQVHVTNVPLDMTVHTPESLKKDVASGVFAQYPDHHLAGKKVQNVE